MSHKRKHVNNYESEEVGVRKRNKSMRKYQWWWEFVTLPPYYVESSSTNTSSFDSSFLYSFHLLLMINFVYKNLDWNCRCNRGKEQYQILMNRQVAMTKCSVNPQLIHVLVILFHNIVKDYTKRREIGWSQFVEGCQKEWDIKCCFLWHRVVPFCFCP